MRKLKASWICKPKAKGKQKEKKTAGKEGQRKEQVKEMNKCEAEDGGNLRSQKLKKRKMKTHVDLEQ